MKHLKTHFEHIFITSHLLRWTLLVIPVSLTAGSLIAFFLWLPDKAIRFRLDIVHFDLFLLWKVIVAGIAEAKKDGIMKASHKDLLQSKIVIFKEVGFWNVD